MKGYCFSHWSTYYLGNRDLRMYLSSHHCRFLHCSCQSQRNQISKGVDLKSETLGISDQAFSAADFSVFSIVKSESPVGSCSKILLTHIHIQQAPPSLSLTGFSWLFSTLSCSSPLSALDRYHSNPPISQCPDAYPEILLSYQDAASLVLRKQPNTEYHLLRL